MESKRRYTRSFPSEETEDFAEGIRQAELNNKKYHYLRAAVLGKFKVTGVIPSSSAHGHFFPHCTLDFGEYSGFHLDQISGEKIHPEQDGSVDHADVEEYQKELTGNWKVVEGGILACAGKARAFFNIMLNYNSPSRTSGNAEMDAFFAQLKNENFSKDLIPCMFFATGSGCLDARCPFEHDELKMRAARSKILDARRKYMRAPSPKKVMDHRARMRLEWLEETVGTPGDDTKTVDYDNPPESLYCAFPSCNFTWEIPVDGNIASTPLRLCSGCKWTYYCSTKCQKDDWKRHKREPCKPLEIIIDDDSLWSPIGTRKGTEPFNVHWGTD